jgi:cytochrome c-type biogenesis protein CcmH
VRRLAALAAAGLALLCSPPALAAECPKTTLGDVEDEVMCPVCGTPLALATEAPQAQRERELVQRLIDGCKSKGEIKAALATEFGDSVLALPDDEGFDLAAYVVPALAILLGVAAVGAAWWRWRRRHGPDESQPASPAGDAARLEADIERYDL